MSDDLAHNNKRSDLLIEDPKAFINRVKELNELLKKRIPNQMWELNYSRRSLNVIDEYLGNYINSLMSENKNILDNMDGDLILEIVAYVGEVLRRSNNANWDVDESEEMPRLVLDVVVDRKGKLYIKRIDIYENIFRTIVEGRLLSNWIKNEIQ